MRWQLPSLHWVEAAGNALSLDSTWMQTTVKHGKPHSARTLYVCLQWKIQPLMFSMTSHVISPFLSLFLFISQHFFSFFFLECVQVVKSIPHWAIQRFSWCYTPPDTCWTSPQRAAASLPRVCLPVSRLSLRLPQHLHQLIKPIPQRTLLKHYLTQIYGHLR